MKTFALLNDTRVDNHMGCRVVSGRIVDELGKRGYRHVASMNHGPDFEPYLASIGPSGFPDLVVINGEGTLHDDAARGIEMLEFANVMKERGSRVVLLNSVWQNNTEASNRFLPMFDAIYVREPYSACELKNVGIRAAVCPDLVLSTDPARIFRMPFFDRLKVTALRLTSRPRPIVTDCAIPSNTERLKNIALHLNSHMHLMGSQTSRDDTNGLSYVEMTEADFLSPDTFLIGGRFHACCFAILANIPFLYLSSNTHKIEGTLEWFGIDPEETRLPVGSDTWSAREFAGYLGEIRAFKLKAMRGRKAQLAVLRTMTEAMFDSITV